MKEKIRRRRTFLLSRRTLGIVAGALAAALMLYAVGGSPIAGAAATKRELPIYCVQRDAKVAALTFDAAWGNEDTEMLIDILGRYNVKATFFVVGEWVTKYPESVKALFDAGHDVMNHSDDHAHFARLSAEEIRANISACNDKIEAVTGVRPTLFRAPYGEYDDNVIKTVKGMGMDTIQWDVDSLDWKDLSPADITGRVTSRVGAGSIVLFHNAAKNTPKALTPIIEWLLQNGYTLVKVRDLLLTGEYAIDHTGRQIPAGAQ